MADGTWLVVGADGGIGRPLLAALRAAGRPAVGTSRRGGDAALSLDLAAGPAAWHLPDRVAVAYLCAAVTSIDACRRDPAGTAAVNVSATLALAGQLRDRGAHVVFLSTNQVFDGTVPLRREDAPTCPLTEYGRQKADVEAELLDHGATVVRLTKVVPPDWPLLRNWAAALGRGEAVEAFADMVLAPVPLAFVVDTLARVGAARAGGVFHVSAAADLTYADFARRLAARVGADPALVRETSITARGIAPDAAPAHTALSAERLRRQFGLAPPPADAVLDVLFPPPATLGRAA